MGPAPILALLLGDQSHFNIAAVDVKIEPDVQLVGIKNKKWFRPFRRQKDLTAPPT